jgi:hypothetical protein
MVDSSENADLTIAVVEPTINCAFSAITLLRRAAQSAEFQSPGISHNRLAAARGKNESSATISPSF